MSDVITTARTARESLARALNALQSDPNAPPQLMELAAPIAQAMGALMNIERTQQIMPHADLALNNVRTALSSLQQQSSMHPSVGQAMEAVASSLGLVHNLCASGSRRPRPSRPPFPPSTKRLHTSSPPRPTRSSPRLRTSSPRLRTSSPRLRTSSPLRLPRTPSRSRRQSRRRARRPHPHSSARTRTQRR